MVLERVTMHSEDVMSSLLRAGASLLERDCVISCVETASEMADHQNWLRLHFRDSNDDPDAVPEQSRTSLFNCSDADRIVTFLLCKHQEAVRRTLRVNCLMGASRSGTVALFAREAFDLDRVMFAADNPRCLLHLPRVYNILRERWLAFTGVLLPANPYLPDKNSLLEKLLRAKNQRIELLQEQLAEYKAPYLLRKWRQVVSLFGKEMRRAQPKTQYFDYCKWQPPAP